jgi:hypothetical protein
MTDQTTQQNTPSPVIAPAPVAPTAQSAATVAPTAPATEPDAQ